jgi:5-methylcytosine-specific restriction endonuclease McrA
MGKRAADMTPEQRARKRARDRARRADSKYNERRRELRRQDPDYQKRQATREQAAANRADRKRENMRRWTADNAEHVREKARLWRQKNADRLRAKRLASGVDRTETKRVKSRAYYAANREARQVKHREYYRDNTDKRYAWKAARRARLAGAVCTATRKQIADLKLVWGCCAYCFRSDRRLTVDHLTPLSRGGSHTIDNLVPACRPCNSSKGTRTLSEFRP